MANPPPPQKYAIFHTIYHNDTLTYDTWSISKFSKMFSSMLAESLLIKLLKLPDKYHLQSVNQYYSSFVITDKFYLSNIC